MDDKIGRRIAQFLNVPCIGTVGVLLEAKAKGLVTAVKPILDALRVFGFYLSDELYKRVLEDVGEANLKRWQECFQLQGQTIFQNWRARQMLRAWFAPIPLPAGEEQGCILLPKVSVEDLQAIVKVLRKSASSLKGMAVAEIARKLETVARQWQRYDLTERKNALELLPQTSPFSEPVCRQAIDALMEPITTQRLLGLLDELLGSHKALDDFVDRPSGVKQRAFGADLAFLVLAGNIVGVGIWDIVFCLLCKTPVLVKPSSDEPILPTLFAQTIEKFAPELSQAVAVVPFPSEQEDLLSVVLKECDAVIVYGTDETVEAVKRKTPAKVRFVERGHRFSVAIVDADFADERTAELLALDVARFDQRGCLSPQVCFVMGHGARDTGQGFGEKVARALERLGKELPTNLREGEKASLVQFRLTCEMLGAEVLTAEDGTWVVAIWDDGNLTAWQKVSCAARVVHIVAAKSLDEIFETLKPFGKFLQGIAVAMNERQAEKVAEVFGQLGATRICPIGQLQVPPIEWSQDGKHLISELVRWCDFEPIVLPPKESGWVEIFRGDADQAVALRFELEQKGIPVSLESDVDPSNPTVPVHRLRVPAQFLDEATQAISSLESQ